jgi:hypothetical protein
MTNKTSNKTTFEPVVFDDVRNGDDAGAPRRHGRLPRQARQAQGARPIFSRRRQLLVNATRRASSYLSPVYAARGRLSGVNECAATTASRSGLSVTAPMGVQVRVVRDQRDGLRSRAAGHPSRGARDQWNAHRDMTSFCVCIAWRQHYKYTTTRYLLLCIPVHRPVNHQC